MSDEQDVDIEEIKERIQIPVDEEVEELKEQEKQQHRDDIDLAEEFRKFGRQFAETVQLAWHSEERQRVESEIRAGVKSFADEVDKVIREAKRSDTAEKVRTEAEEVKTRVETGELNQRARESIVQGLNWMSSELSKLAEQFNPPQKSPGDVESGDEPSENKTA